MATPIKQANSNSHSFRKTQPLRVEETMQRSGTKVKIPCHADEKQHLNVGAVYHALFSRDVRMIALQNINRHRELIEKGGR